MKATDFRFICSLLLLFAAYLFATHAFAEQGSYRVTWSRKIDAEGRNTVWDFVAWSEPGAKLIAIEKSVDADLWTIGKFTLWEFESDGKLVRRTVISERSKDESIGRMPGSVIGGFDLANGEILLLGKIFSSDFAFNTFNRERNLISSIKLPEKIRRCELRRAVLTADKKILMVGSRHEPIAISTDLSGNVEWVQTYHRQAPSNMIFDAALTHDDKHFLLAGVTGDLNKFGLGEASVWLLLCDRRGKVERERIFPGRFPHLAGPLVDGNLAIVYDQKSRELTSNKLAAIDENLKLAWSQDVEMSHAWVMQPSICKSGPDRFIVAGAVRTQLRVREYDALGNQLRSFDQNIEGKNAYVTIIAKDKHIIIAMSTFDSRRLRRAATVYGLSAAD